MHHKLDSEYSILLVDLANCTIFWILHWFNKRNLKIFMSINYGKYMMSKIHRYHNSYIQVNKWYKLHYLNNNFSNIDLQLPCYQWNNTSHIQLDIYHTLIPYLIDEDNYCYCIIYKYYAKHINYSCWNIFDKYQNYL